MVVELDHNAIKTRIADIIKDNAAIFDATPSDDSKFRQVLVGVPDFQHIDALPAMYITNDDIIEEGIRIGQISGNTAVTSEITFNYLLIYLDQEKDAVTTEKKLDDFQKEIMQSLKANYDLRSPSTGLDPKCARSWPMEVIELNNALVGKARRGRQIKLRCVAHTS